MNEEILKNKNNILYKPDLDYEKNYDTAGYITEIDEVNESHKDSVIESLKNNINGINGLMNSVSEDMQELIKMPLSIVEQILGEFEEPTVTSNSVDTITVINTPDTEPDDNQELLFPSGPFSDRPDPFVITRQENNKAEVIEDKYNYDMISIINDYLKNLNNVMIQYVNSIIASFNNIEPILYSKALGKYTASSADVSPDLKHLSDLIIRSQITRKMKMRFYSNMFNVDKTIAHIRACKVTVEQRKRYYEANYNHDKDFNSVISNRLLENSRITYDVKYKENFTNLYKYLNSSVIVLNECFKMLINETQAKIILLEKEGNDLW